VKVVPTVNQQFMDALQCLYSINHWSGASTVYDSTDLNVGDASGGPPINPVIYINTNRGHAISTEIQLQLAHMFTSPTRSTVRGACLNVAEQEDASSCGPLTIGYQLLIAERKLSREVSCV
jgi:hypothetical protein